MKKRSMILALASMLGVSAAATAVSGFAWFTAQTTALVQEHTYKVGASMGSLVIAAGSDKTNVTSCAVENNVATITRAPGALADVSSKDGKHFYQLKNIVNSASSHSADVVDEGDLQATTHMSTVNTTQLVAVSWTLTVTNEAGAGAPVDVYISKATPIFTHSAGTKDYLNAYRMAIYEGETLVFLYAETTAFIQAADFNNSTKAYKYDTIGGWDGTGVIDEGKYVKGSDMKLITSSSSEGVVSGVTSEGDQLLIKGLAASAKTLKFVVWCEGTATPEEAVDTANEVKCSFELAGIAA